MADANDMDLMRRYAEGNSEAAFGELVQRHINFVYSVALRHVRDAQDAQDVTQAVFIILARKISGLRHRATLTGWLYETTRFTARQLLRTKTRRQAREQEAYMESIVQSLDTDTVWKQLAPILEDAMARLSAQDRALLALHFFENKSMAETASLLGINEWAVRKRAERAVEKLRAFFHRRGIAVPASVLTAALSANSVHAAPAGLAGMISTVASAKGAAASASTLTLTKGALKLMFWSKTTTAVSTGLAFILIAGVTTLSVEKVRGLETNAPPAAGKTVISTMLEISAQYYETPDSLLDNQKIDWQPGDSGSFTAVIATLRETNIVRALRGDRNAIVVGRPGIAFGDDPGKTSRGSVSMGANKNSTAKLKIGTRLDVTATLAPDSQSVDLKLGAAWHQLANGLNGTTNEIDTTTTLSLNPGQCLVMRAPLHDADLDASAGPRSLVIFITPGIQNVKVRYQSILRHTSPN